MSNLKLKLKLTSFLKPFFFLKAYSVTLKTQFLSLSLQDKAKTSGMVLFLIGVVTLSIDAIKAILFGLIPLVSSIGKNDPELSSFVLAQKTGLSVGVVLCFFILGMLVKFGFKILSFSKKQQIFVFDEVMSQHQALIEKAQLQTSLPQAAQQTFKNRL